MIVEPYLFERFDPIANILMKKAVHLPDCEKVTWSYGPSDIMTYGGNDAIVYLKCLSCEIEIWDDRMRLP
jgi:hypothetical protein